MWNAIKVAEGDLYAWNDASTYIQEPPFLIDLPRSAGTIEPLSGARAVAEVAGSLPFVMQETAQSALAVDVVARALESVPVYRLHFRKSDAFWGVVEES